jgi:hypothetical protein
MNAARPVHEILLGPPLYAGDGLIQMCWFAMIPEPLQFVPLNDGWHLAGDPPFKTVIDIHSLKWRWIEPDESRGTVTVNLPDKILIYDRVATDAHGHWICTLRRTSGD